MRLKRYRLFVQMGMQEAIAYRTDFFLYRLGDVFGAVISWFLWRAVYQSSAHQVLNGFTLSEMTFYIVLSFMTQLLISNQVSFLIGNEVKDGSIAMRLLKPLNFIGTYLAIEIGFKLMVILFMLLPLAIIGMLLYLFGLFVINTNPLIFLAYLISMMLSYLTIFYFDVCFGFSAFIFQHLWGSNLLKRTIVAFFSGSLLPLAFFPNAVATLFSYLPFASFVYTPVMIALGKYEGKQLCFYLGLQLFWGLFFFYLSKWVWRLTIGRLSIQGG